MFGANMTEEDKRWVMKHPELITPEAIEKTNYYSVVTKVEQILPEHPIDKHTYTFMAFDTKTKIKNALINWMAMQDQRAIVWMNTTDNPYYDEKEVKRKAGYYELISMRHDDDGRLRVLKAKSIDYNKLGLDMQYPYPSEIYYVTRRGEVYISNSLGNPEIRGRGRMQEWSMSRYTFDNVEIGYYDNPLVTPVDLSIRCQQRGGSPHLWIVIGNKPIRYDKLVAHTWVPNPSNYQYISHIDGDPLNCNASNLVWVSQPCDMVKCKRVEFDEDGVAHYIEKPKRRAVTCEHLMKEVKLCDGNGNVIAVYKSIAEAEKLTGVTRARIRRSISHGKDVCGRYFKYTNVDENTKNPFKRVYIFSLYDMDDNYRFSCATLKDVSLQLGVPYYSVKYAYEHGRFIGGTKLKVVREENNNG